MSGEKNELTFMRCPSCRSLVPTGSVKCRMCGFAFEGDTGDADAAQRSSGRVRQRTVSKSREEILAALEQAEMSSKPRASMGAATENGMSDKTTSDDPESVVDAVEPPEVIDQTEANQTEDNQTEANQTEAAEEAPMEEASEEEAEAVLADSGSVDSDAEQDSEDEGQVATEPDEHTGESRGAPVEDKRRVEEQPFKLKARSGSLSLRTVRPSAQPDVKDELAEPEEEETETHVGPPDELPVVESAEAVEQSMGEEQVSTDVAETHSAADVSEGTVIGEVESPPAANDFSHKVEVVVEEGSVEEFEPQAPAVNRPGRVKTKEVTMNSNDALIGWLVSYADQAGRSVELRGKKFLVSSERIRDNDLVLEDQSISAPHCLVGRMGEGLQVQDLLSDRGIHLKKRGEDEFNQVETCTVESGDTIKFGELEYLVVLIP